MTEKLYQTNQYLKECTAAVTAVDGNLVTSPAWPGNTAILKEFICLLEQQ